MVEFHSILIKQSFTNFEVDTAKKVFIYLLLFRCISALLSSHIVACDIVNGYHLLWNPTLEGAPGFTLVNV